MASAMRSQQWRKATVEFGVIVLGVLVALWIDAGWAWVQDRGEERELIADLRSDFEFNLSEIERMRALRRDVLAQTDRLFVSGVGSIPSDSVRLVLARIGQHWSLNPRMGALDGAVQSGRISVLRDRELRNALAAWRGVFEDAEEEVIQILPTTARYSESVVSLGRRLGVPVLPDSSQARFLMNEISADPDIMGLLGTKSIYLDVSVRGLDRLESETNGILELLAQAGGGT